MSSSEGVVTGWLQPDKFAVKGQRNSKDAACCISVRSICWLCSVPKYEDSLHKLVLKMSMSNSAVV